MHQDFDGSLSRVEQILRVSSAKEPGRKHQKRPGSRALERRKASRLRAAKLRAAKIKRLKDAVAAYWRGDRDTYPAH